MIRIPNPTEFEKKFIPIGIILVAILIGWLTVLLCKLMVERVEGYETYTVRTGDTLWSIAQATYGKGSQWPRIREANKDATADPSKLQPGTVLYLPKEGK